MADANETIDLGKIQEGSSTVKEEDIGTRRLLDGFKKLNIKLNFITEDITRIFKRQKYENLFDTAVLSINTNEFLHSDDGMKVFKPGAKVHVETVDTLVLFKKEQRKEYRDGVIKRMTERGHWKLEKDMFGKVHLLFKALPGPYKTAEEVQEKGEMKVDEKAADKRPVTATTADSDQIETK